MISLTLENFKALSKKGNLIPIFKEISLDYDNPLSILKKISSKKYCFLLESSDGPEKWSQYSFLGFDGRLKHIKSLRNNFKEYFAKTKSLLFRQGDMLCPSIFSILYCKYL